MSDKKITVTTTPKNRIVITKGGSYSGIDTLAELRDVDTSNKINNDVLVYDQANDKFVIKEAPFVNSSYQTANAAFNKANSANLLAFNTGIGANAWANTKVSSINGTAGQIYSSGGTTPTLNLVSTGVAVNTYGGANQIPVITVDTFGRLTSAANVTVQGMDYPYANNIGAASNAYANVVGAAANAYAASLTPDLSPPFNKANAAYTVANVAFDKANAANLLAFNTGIGANNYAGAMVNAANAYAATTYYPKTGGLISGDLSVSGNVTVSGNITYVNTQTLLVGDNIVTLNADLPSSVTPVDNAGIEVNRGNKNSNAALLFIESANAWAFTSNNLQNITTYIASNTDVASAFNKANNALANTSGVSFAGNLYFPTGSVGIGTTSPSYALDVNGTIQAQSTGSASIIINPASGNYAQLLLQNAGTTRWRIRHNDTEDYLSLYDERKSGGAGSQLVVKDVTGFVGIGNTSPSSRLQVNGTLTVANTGPVQVFRSSAANTISVNMYDSANGTLSWEGSAGQLFSITNDLTGSIFSVNDVSGIPSIDVNANGIITLAQYNGKVGIGTSIPNSLLQVGAFSTSGGNDSILTVAAGSSKRAELKLFDYSTSYGFTIRSDGSGGANEKLSILRHNNDTTGIEALSILRRTGDVGIGTTTPAYKLDVAGDARITGNVILGDASTDTVTVNATNFTLANNVSFDSGTLFIDKTNDRIGIGNVLPNTKLDVTGSASIGYTSGTTETELVLNGSNDWFTRNQIIWKRAGSTYFIAGLPGSVGLGSDFFIGQNNDGTSPYIFIKRNTSNIGIGTSSPSAKLHVTYAGTDVNGTPGQYISGADRGSFIGFAATATGGKTWAVGSTSDTHTVGGSKFALTLLDTNSTKLVVDANGNVGINTSSPAYKLDVNGAIGFNGDIVKTSGDNFNFIVNSRTVISGAGSGVQTIRSSSSGLNVIHTDTSATRLFISDNIGIGTTSPSAKLHVAGDAIFTGNVTVSGNTTYMNTQTLLIGDNILTLNADIPNTAPATENAGIEVNRGAFGNASIIWDETNDRWDIRANNSNLVSVLSTGSVGIGTTSPTSKLHVIGTGNITSNLVVQGYDVVPTIFSAAVGNSTNTQVTFNDNGYANGSNDLLFIKGEGRLIANVIASNTIFVGRNQMDSTQIELGAAGEYNIDKFLSSSAKAVQYNLVFETEDRQYHSTQVSLLHNDATSYITEYGIIYTGNNLATVTTSLSSMNVYLNVTTTYANTIVNIFRVATGIDPRPSYYNAVLNADGDPLLARDGSGIVLRG